MAAAGSTAREPRAVRVLEFFSGIGGLHFALRRAALPHHVAMAFDVDEAANETYAHNLRSAVSAADLRGVSVQQISQLHAEMWLLSPPCQPYSRQGLQRGSADGRAAALSHLIGVLQHAPAHVLPLYLLLENVVGFESSGMRASIYATLRQRGYSVREAWASPAHFGIPNQRTRYFLLARRTSEGSAGPSDSASPPEAAAAAPALLSDFTPPPPPIAPLLLSPCDLQAAVEREAPLAPPRGEVPAEVQERCRPLNDFLLPEDGSSLSDLAVPLHIVERYGAAMDVVGRQSRRSICFTKNYSRYIKGTGSLVAEGLDSPSLPEDNCKSLEELAPLRVRFMAPREIAAIHGFPSDFDFPPSVGKKKQYELLGNSLSVQVVSELLAWLASELVPPTQQLNDETPEVLACKHDSTHHSGT
ncbi:hypothetical protein AB1Y20_015196 [Prymnesium parvum]|uniref:DNA (cytosine-5-)-methyltransferase n=1 Tax=Prymnesium parvum TaxID=97485 RepID=A0AB34K0U9_PRYPA